MQPNVTLLTVGQHLMDSHGGGYTVTAVRRCTDWNVLYEGNMVLLNYRYKEREFYPANPDEHLPVLLRSGTSLNPAHEHSAASLRDLLRFEATQVLGRIRSAWLPEPLDVLEQGAGRDAGEDPSAGNNPRVPERAPVLVMARPAGVSLTRWCSEAGGDRARETVQRFRWVSECLCFVESLHRAGLLLCGLDADDMFVDAQGRLGYVGTDRIVRQDQMPRLRPYFPSHRFFGPWSAPECREPHGWLDARTDLYHWAAFGVWMLTARDLRGAELREQLSTTLEAVARHAPDNWNAAAAGRTGAQARRFSQSWCDTLVRCLEPDPADRPQAVHEVRSQLPGGDLTRM